MKGQRGWKMTRAEKEDQYYEKLEQVFRFYERSLDLDLALTVVPLSDAERVRLLEDEELEARIFVLDAQNRTEMVEQLRALGKTAMSEGVRLAALKELGKTYYPKRFKDIEPVSEKQRVIRYEVVEAE